MALMTYVRNQWDRVLAWFLVAAGALALILGWVGVTSTPYTFEMIPYVLSGGLGGLFLLGVGAMVWLSADLRDEWRTLRELLDRDATAPVGQGAGAQQAGTPSFEAEQAAVTPTAAQTDDPTPVVVPALAKPRTSRATPSRNSQGRPKRVSQ